MKNKSDMAYFTAYALLGTRAAADTVCMAIRGETNPVVGIAAGCMGILTVFSFIMAVRSLMKAVK